MNIKEMAMIAKEHWRAHYPKEYRQLVNQGQAEKEAEAAAKLTMREMETLMLGGMSEAEAWQAARELWILNDPLKV